MYPQPSLSTPSPTQLTTPASWGMRNIISLSNKLSGKSTPPTKTDTSPPTVADVSAAMPVVNWGKVRAIVNVEMCIGIAGLIV